MVAMRSGEMMCGNALADISDEEDLDPPEQLRRSQIAALPPRLPPQVLAQMRHIWSTIFGGRRSGERALDVKVGEWERKMYGGRMAVVKGWEHKKKSYVKLRPHERDDRLDQVVITAKGRMKDHC